MPTYYGYLRVSRDSQDVASQRLGLLDYANTYGYTPLVLVDETISRDQSWRRRAIGDLILKKARPGDFVLTPEFTRLGASPVQVFSILEAAAERKITLIVTKTNTVMDGGLNSQIQAVAFSIASMIELDFIRIRTREGLQRARIEGRKLGRPKGSQGRLKLDPQREKIGELYRLGLSVPKLARHFEVTEKTMRKFIARYFSGSSAPRDADALRGAGGLEITGGHSGL